MCLEKFFRDCGRRAGFFELLVWGAGLNVVISPPAMYLLLSFPMAMVAGGVGSML